MLKTVLRRCLPRPAQKRLHNWFFQNVFKLSQRYGIQRLWVYRCANIGYLDQQPPLQQLAPAEQGRVYTPRRHGQAPSAGVAVPVPAVNLYTFQNALVSPLSSHIITANAVLLERLPHLPIQACNYATGAVRYHDHQRALYHGAVCQTLEEGILIAGNGAFNYYHWLTEILPKLHYVCEHRLDTHCRTLLLPEAARTIPAFAHSLQAVLAGQSFHLVYLTSANNYRVKRLYTLTSPSAILFNPRQQLANPVYNYYRESSLNAIRRCMAAHSNAYPKAHLNSLLEALQFEQKGRRLYLARKPDGRRSYNQHQVRTLLVERHNFCEVFLEEYPLAVQVWLFANARLLVGASGAAWANLLFCRPGTQAISWLPEHLMAFSAYASLAHYQGVNMTFVAATCQHPHELHPAHTVPLDELERRIHDSAEIGK